MSAVWMRVRSELRAGRRSLLALALLIAIASAAVLAPLAGARRTGSAYDRFLADANAHDVETNEGVPGLGYAYSLDLERAAALPEVDEYEIQSVYPVGFRTSTSEALPGSEAVVLRPKLFEGGGLSRARVLSGRLPDPTRADEVAIGYGLGEREGIRRGDRLTIQLLSRDLLTKGFDFTTVLEELEVSVVGVLLLPGAIPPAIRYGQIYATPAFDERFRDRTATALGLFVRLDRGAQDLETFKNNLVAIAEPPGSNIQFLTSNDQDGGVRRSIDIYVVALQAFAVLAAAAALLIVTQTVLRQLALGSDDHPALRALGMTPGQLVAGSILKTAVATLAGVAGGIAISYALSPVFPLGTARIVESSRGVSFDLTVLAGGGVAIALLIIAFAIPTAFRADRRAAREEAGAPEGQPRPSRAAALLSGTGAPTSVVAGVRLALERGRGRSAIPVWSTVIASAVAVASIVTLIAFGASMRNLVDTPYLYGWNWDALAGNPYGPDLKANVLPALESVDDIVAYSSGATNVRIQVGRPGGATLDSQALALNARKGEVFPPILEGRWPTDDDEVALGTGTMRALDVSIGETIEASLADEVIRVTVVGQTVFPVVGDQYGGELGRGAGFTMEGLRRIAPNALENMFPVRFRRPNTRVVDLPPEARSLFFFQEEDDEILGSKPQDLANLSRITGAPLALTALVGLLGIATIAHALATSVRRRRRDFAVLKTLGFVRAQVRAAVVAQATSLALVTVIVGVPLGVILGRTAWLTFAERQGVVPEATLAAWPILALIPATILLANLVAALPGRAAARLAPATVLRTE